MKKAFLLFATMMLAACPDPGSDVKVDLAAVACVAPATVDYECPNGNCPDSAGCNWCGCNLGSTGAWACTQRLCVNATPDAGSSAGCQTDADCGSGLCRFSAGCPSTGRCMMASESFFPDCVAFQPATSTTACLCDGTSQKVQVDCTGVSHQFKNLGACK